MGIVSPGSIFPLRSLDIEPQRLQKKKKKTDEAGITRFMSAMSTMLQSAVSPDIPVLTLWRREKRQPQKRRRGVPETA